MPASGDRRLTPKLATVPRNTRYQAGATPYLHRSSTGWTAPASPGAHVTDCSGNGPAGRDLETMAGDKHEGSRGQA